LFAADLSDPPDLTDLTDLIDLIDLTDLIDLAFPQCLSTKSKSKSLPETADAGP
jgi:hypothetical protein